MDVHQGTGRTVTRSRPPAVDWQQARITLIWLVGTNDAYITNDTTDHASDDDITVLVIASCFWRWCHSSANCIMLLSDDVAVQNDVVTGQVITWRVKRWHHSFEWWHHGSGADITVQLMTSQFEQWCCGWGDDIVVVGRPGLFHSFVFNDILFF